MTIRLRMAIRRLSIGQFTLRHPSILTLTKIDTSSAENALSNTNDVTDTYSKCRQNCLAIPEHTVWNVINQLLDYQDVAWNERLQMSKTKCQRRIAP